KPINKSRPPESGMASINNAVPCSAQAIRAIAAAKVDAPTPPLAPTTVIRNAAAWCCSVVRSEERRVGKEGGSRWRLHDRGKWCQDGRSDRDTAASVTNEAQTADRR